MYLCTNKGKNMTKIIIMLMIPNFADSNFTAYNVDQFHTKLEETLYSDAICKVWIRGAKENEQDKY